MYQTYLLIIGACWVLIISFVAVWVLVYFRRLSRGVEKGNLINILESLIKKEEEHNKAIKAIEKVVKDIRIDSVHHVQKIGIVRFNPFRELGGDHSFSLALLDAKSSGFVITGLHTRERTRVYVKTIDKGESKFELSKEEKEAVKKAQKSEGNTSS